eukprot:523249_1
MNNTNIDNKTQCSELDNMCLYAKRIVNIIHIYYEYINNNKDNNDIDLFKLINTNNNNNNNISLHNLIEDYYHIRKYHEINNTFITDLINIQCNIDNCLCIKRSYNYNNQSIYSNKQLLNQIYFGYDALNDINIIKWLDIIHIYFMHYKCSQTANNNNVFVDNYDNYDNETSYDNFKTLQPWNTCNIDNNDNENDNKHNNNEEYKCEVDKSHKTNTLYGLYRKQRYFDIYNKSKRFYYGWKYYKNNTMTDPLNNNETYSSLFIEPYYINLKQELLA